MMQSCASNGAIEAQSSALQWCRFTLGHPDLELISGRFRKCASSNNKTSSLACAMDIPVHTTIAEFCRFTSSFNASVTQMQILSPALPSDSPEQQDSSEQSSASAPQYYWILMHFRNPAACRSFKLHFNGRRFNSVEEDVCKVVSVSTVRFHNGISFPFAVPADARCSVCLDLLHPHLPADSDSASLIGHTSHADDNTEADIVCTIAGLCRHRFHTSCLSKWHESSCPLCRCRVVPPSQSRSQCAECGSSDALWMCLVCGHIGCGRYHAGHAFAHFESTSHTYALDVVSRRVWDYAGDNFVHRILRGHSDGKLVALENSELPPSDITGSFLETRSSASSVGIGMKLEDIALEYNELLTTQLQEQCRYFQKRRDAQKCDFNNRFESAQSALNDSRAREQDLVKQVLATEKSKVEAEKRLAEETLKLEEKQKQMRQLKALGSKLLATQKSMEERLAASLPIEAQISAKVAEVKAMREQLQDIRFYVQTQKKLLNSPNKADLSDGTVVLVEQPQLHERLAQHKQKMKRARGKAIHKSKEK